MMSFRRWLARLRGSGRPGRRADVRALLSLDDRMLADIGLRRAEVAAVANGQLPLGQLTGRRSVSATDRQRRPSGPTAPVAPGCPAAA
jgi:uncharacterized protein YjiS (DUF1127 family)